MIVDEFHELASSFDVWELHQMECLGANKLRQQQLKEAIRKDLVRLIMLVTEEDRVHHRAQHPNLDEHADGIVHELFALDLFVEMVFVTFCLQEGQNCHFQKRLVEHDLGLVHDVFSELVHKVGTFLLFELFAYGAVERPVYGVSISMFLALKLLKRVTPIKIVNALNDLIFN